MHWLKMTKPHHVGTTGKKERDTGQCAVVRGHVKAKPSVAAKSG
jgi:hypothetical protein